MSRHIQLLISEEFAEKIIPENDSVRLCDDIIDEMNLYSLFHTYSDRGRKYATNPRTLLRILVYANMQGIYSSRDIETACKRDINFMWLLNGEKTPNHFEIARFRSKRLSQCKDEIFYQLVNKLAELKEIKFEHLFVDGTKIEANANKYSFVRKKSTNKYESRLLEKLEKIHFDFIENMIKTYWKGMLDLGATTVWEEYNPNLSGTQHYEMYSNKYGKSLCHAWGASPIYLLGKYYLGVKPTSSGYETFEVKPYLGGFKFIEGVVPIKDGSVRVKMSNDKLSVMATKNGGTLIWKDTSYTLEANKEFNINI